MGDQTVSGPTQTAVEGASKEWAPRPRLAAAVRLSIFVFPYAVGFTFAVVAGRMFPAHSLGVNRVVWFLGVAALSTLLMIPADRFVRRLIPITGLLTVALGFPDAAPSRFKAAMRGATTAQVQRRIRAALEADVVEADLDRNQYLLDLVSMLTRHDRLTRGHSERVRAYSTLIGEELRLSKSEHQKLYWAALLHDIGKLDVPEEILNKSSRPNDEEWSVLQRHPAAAERYLLPLQGWLGEWAKAATEHHLRWDGKGYPKGLAGNDISLAGRLVAIADAYDVMTSARSYKHAMSAADARVELSRCAGGQFDPHLIRAFLNVGLTRVRLAGGILVSLPALINAILGGLATNGGRVLMATTAVGTGVVAAPMIDIVPPAPVEVATEAPTSDRISVPTPTATPTIPTPATVQVRAAAAPVVVVPATATPTATPTPPVSDLEFEFDESVPPTRPTPAPLIVVPATATPVASVEPSPSPTTQVSITTQLEPSGSTSNRPEATSTTVPSAPSSAVVTPTAPPTATVAPTSTPTPVPSPTPIPIPIPTSSPVATSTPIPTATAAATSTPIPTATAAATSTPIPTASATPVPIPTATAIPTSTPADACPGTPGCPAAVDDSYDFISGQRRRLEILDNDLRQGGSRLDERTLKIIEVPQHAVMSELRVHGDHVHYRAVDGYVGRDSFIYRICNDDGLCHTATVSIQILLDGPLPDVCTGFTEHRLVYSLSPDRSDARPLGGEAFVGPDTEFFVFATVPDSAVEVAFHIDDRDRQRAPVNIDGDCAYDLRGTGSAGLPAAGIRMSDLGSGFHTLTIVVQDAGRAETVIHADFAVLIAGGPMPTPSPTPAGVGLDCALAQYGGLDLVDADLVNCDLSGLDLRDADLDGANLQGANLSGADLSEVDLTGVLAQGANFQGADLSAADFDDAKLQNANLAYVVATDADFDKANLQGASLAGADMSGADLDEAQLQNADLSTATLAGADLIKVNLNDAILTGADLRDVDFKEARLHRANLQTALIQGASFDDAELNNADFTGAIGVPADDGDDARYQNTICPDGSVSSVGCWP